MGFDYRTFPGLWRQILGGHKQNLLHTRSEEKEAVSPQQTKPDLLVSIQECAAEVWVNSGLLWGQGHLIQQSWELWHAGISPFEGGRHYHHYPYQGGNIAPPINRKLD